MKMIGRLTVAAALALSLPAMANLLPEPPGLDAFEEARMLIDRGVAQAQAAARSDDERALILADLLFNSAAQDPREVAAAFASRFLPDGVMFGGSGPIAFGPEAVRAALADNTASWYWGPAGVAVSGDLGVTWGLAVLGVPGEDGQPQAVTTRYVTVWKRQADGGWKIWLDAGNAGPLSLPPPVSP